MTSPPIHIFDSLPSTNSAIASEADSLPHGAVYAAIEQTAGRGQRGNSWEAEPGKNLTFSILLRPESIRPTQAFAISMLTSMSIADALQTYIQGNDIEIKWPNDIYVGNLKLAGILIENSFSGQSIDRSIIGIGLNVNQTIFRSDAPNPVSMKNLTGQDYDLNEILSAICQHILDDLESYQNAPDIATLTAAYRARQWRGTGIHRWRDNLANETVEAAIADILPDGHLILGTVPPRKYAFKEISAII